MLATEARPVEIAAFLLAWGILNFFWLALTRRPAVAGALSLVMMTVLVLLSELKYHVLMMTANFVDLMIIDTDTVSFLFTIYPALRWIVALCVIALVPLVVFTWRADPFRVRRLTAVAAALACVGGLTAIETHLPLQPFEAFYGGNLVSSFARSGVDAISELMTHGLMESDAFAADRLQPVGEEACPPAKKPPHIILIHDESSFDIRMAPGIKVPNGYGAHFKSFDGKERNFLVEGNGGPSWFTEYNVLEGLSARTFGRFSYFVTRIAAGRVERGLPAALRHCGYRTFSLYPALGAFMSARSFQTTTGVQHFFDQHDLGTKEIEPDSFFFDAAARMIGEEHARSPMFVFVYLAANHFPWDDRYRPDLMPQWKDLGNVPPVDEYLRRQAISAQNYSDFLARLKREFPNELVPPGAVRRSSAGFRRAPDRARARRPGHRAPPDGVGSALFHHLLRHRRHQFQTGRHLLGARYAGRSLSAAGRAGGRRPAARSVVRRAEENPRALQRTVLWLR